MVFLQFNEQMNTYRDIDTVATKTDDSMQIFNANDRYIELNISVENQCKNVVLSIELTQMR